MTTYNIVRFKNVFDVIVLGTVKTIIPLTHLEQYRFVKDWAKKRKMSSSGLKCQEVEGVS